MAWQVIFSARCRNDLEHIVRNIARDDPATAERFGSKLIAQAESLGNAPDMGPKLPQKSDTRFFPVGSYLIIYRPDAKRRVVRILRFWHSARRERPTR
jgi:plasmid stabilization system protein ParE